MAACQARLLPIARTYALRISSYRLSNAHTFLTWSYQSKVFMILDNTLYCRFRTVSSVPLVETALEPQMNSRHPSKCIYLRILCLGRQHHNLGQDLASVSDREAS